MQIIRKIALAVFRDKKILQVRTKAQKEAFYTLGGKLEKGEDDIACLKREVKEEIGCEIDEKSLKFLTEFEDEAHGKKDTLVNIRMYTGKLIGIPKPLSEIAEIGWLDSNTDKIHLPLIAQRTIFPWLKAHGLLN